MRTTPTPAEHALWQRLRNNQLGVRFRRQHVVDRFVVDFVCLSKKLIVEVDGPIHESQADADSTRDAHLMTLGYTVFRFPNDQILGDTEQVVKDIAHHLSAQSPSPSPPGKGRDPAPPDQG